MPVAAVMAIGAVASAGATVYAANKAASAQQKAAQQAAATQQAMYNDSKNNLQPYMQSGEAANAELTRRMPELTAPIAMDQATLEQTPGYKFTRDQGLQSVQNSAAARGLGVSGAAMKGAAEYATGLADKTYIDQFNIENTNRTNAYNRLYNAAQLGANAANGLAANALSTGKGVAEAQLGLGNAQGAAAMATGNALSSAANNFSSLYGLNALTGGKLFGSGGSGSMYGSGTGQSEWPPNYVG